MAETQLRIQTSQLLTAKALGQMLSLSKRQVFRLNSCGKIPAPIRIGGSVRWACPSSKGFEAKRPQKILTKKPLATAPHLLETVANHDAQRGKCPNFCTRSSPKPEMQRTKELMGEILLALQSPTVSRYDRDTLLLSLDGLLRRYVDLKYCAL